MVRKNAEKAGPTGQARKRKRCQIGREAGKRTHWNLKRGEEKNHPRMGAPLVASRQEAKGKGERKTDKRKVEDGSSIDAAAQRKKRLGDGASSRIEIRIPKKKRQGGVRTIRENRTQRGNNGQRRKEKIKSGLSVFNGWTGDEEIRDQDRSSKAREQSGRAITTSWP